MSTPNPQSLLLYRKCIKICRQQFKVRMSGYAIRLPMLVIRKRFEDYRDEKDPVVVSELTNLIKDVLKDMSKRPIIPPFNPGGVAHNRYIPRATDRVIRYGFTGYNDNFGPTKKKYQFPL